MIFSSFCYLMEEQPEKKWLPEKEAQPGSRKIRLLEHECRFIGRQTEYTGIKKKGQAISIKKYLKIQQIHAYLRIDGICI